MMMIFGILIFGILICGFGKERYLLYDLIINNIHFHLNDPGGSSYQIVFIKTEMLSKLLGAWQKRSKGNLQGEFSDAEYSDMNVNLYQLEEEDRANLQSLSVRKFLEVMGGCEEVVKLRETIDQILK